MTARPDRARPGLRQRLTRSRRAPVDHDHPGHDPRHRPAAVHRRCCRRSTASATRTVWVDSFAAPGVYVLLALGLNVVVGMAGLLDLGYAAFFAIGAYTYAYGRRGSRACSMPFWLMLLIGAVVAAVFGILLGAPDAAPARRLPGHRDPGLRRDRARRVHERRPVDERHQRHRRHRPAEPAFGTHCFGATSPCPTTSLMARLITVVDDPALPAPGFAARPVVARHPRGRAGGGQHGINTVTTKLLAFALGASHGRLRRRLRRLEAHVRVTRPVPVRGVVHGPGDGRARRHGQHLGRRARRIHHLHAPDSVLLKQLNNFFDSVPRPDPVRHRLLSSTSSCCTAWPWWA